MPQMRFSGSHCAWLQAAGDVLSPLLDVLLQGPTHLGRGRSNGIDTVEKRLERGQRSTVRHLRDLTDSYAAVHSFIRPIRLANFLAEQTNPLITTFISLHLTPGYRLGQNPCTPRIKTVP